MIRFVPYGTYVIIIDPNALGILEQIIIGKTTFSVYRDLTKLYGT
jgi:hypothetical protein